MVDSYTLEIKLNRQEVESLTKKIYDLGFVGEEAINSFIKEIASGELSIVQKKNFGFGLAESKNNKGFVNHNFKNDKCF